MRALILSVIASSCLFASNASFADLAPLSLAQAQKVAAAAA